MICVILNSRINYEAYVVDIAFIAISVIVLISALWVVIGPNLVHSAVSLLFTFFGVSGLYVLLYADFLAGTQIVIYVGGILVLIIFGVMLTNKIEGPIIPSSSRNQVVGLLTSLSLLVILLGGIYSTDWPSASIEETTRESTVSGIGHMLMNEYILPFEVVSILLLAALVGAAVLSRKKTDG